MQFIDLFAGLGGFHIALESLGHECIFACEINKSLAELYQQNFGMVPAGDIRKVDIDRQIPDHDILCGGFPCQPFSIAGKKSGKLHDSGNLFDKIVEILDQKRPKFFILENVPHIKHLQNGAMWQHMEDCFTRLGYEFTDHVYSPHQFGIPQHRKRIYIVGSYGKGSLDNFKWLKPSKNINTDIRMILDIRPSEALKISADRLRCLDVWQRFVDAIPKNETMPLFPIWAAEFGANYPIDDHNYPYVLSADKFSEYKGSFGKRIKQETKEEQLMSLPTYARVKEPFPEWKKRYIRQNREFYQRFKKELKDIKKEIQTLEVPSWQKLEWNVKENKRVIKNYIIQFRQSGIRIKNTDTSPALVCNSTEIPIIGWENRYLTKTEGARLQSISNIDLPEMYSASFKALGNAVNVEIIIKIAENLLSTHNHYSNENLSETYAING